MKVKQQINDGKDIVRGIERKRERWRKNQSKSENEKNKRE